MKKLLALGAMAAALAFFASSETAQAGHAYLPAYGYGAHCAPGYGYPAYGYGYGPSYGRLGYGYGFPAYGIGRRGARLHHRHPGFGYGRGLNIRSGRFNFGIRGY